MSRQQYASGPCAAAGAGAGAGPALFPVQAHDTGVGMVAQRWRDVPFPTRAKKPPCRSGAASVVVGDKMYIFGGYGGEEGRLDDFWEFDFGAWL